MNFAFPLSSCLYHAEKPPQQPGREPAAEDRPCLGERVSLGVTGETPLPTDAQGREEGVRNEQGWEGRRGGEGKN